MAAAAAPPPDLAALQELERRQLTGDPSITPEIGAQIKAKMAAYRQQGLAKPLVNPAVDAMKVSDFGTLLDTIDKADSHVGMTTAGFGGSLFQGIPGSSARDLQSTITSLKANLAFDKLQAMRAASPTGGAIGQVSDTEEKMLSSSVAALDQSQSQDQLKENLANVRKHYTAYIKSLGLDVSKDPKTGSNIVAPLAAAQPVANGGGNDTPGGGKPPPLDPEGVGNIGFADHAHMEANSLPEGAQDFQRQLTDKINSGELKTADDVVAFGRASKLNEGRGFDVNKDQAQAYFDYVKKGGKSGADVQTPQFKTFDISADRGKGGVAESGKAFLRGIPNVVGMDDELAAVGDTFQGGSLRDNLARERAIRDYDEEHHWLARDAGTLATAFAIPTGAPGVARAAGVEALRGGEGMVAARAAARQAFAQRSAVEGAGLAGAYGVGSSDGNIGDRLVSGGLDAATGAATAYGLTRVGGKLGIGGKGPPPNTVGPSNGRDVAAAADHLNIPVMPADVGGATTGRLTAGAAQSPFGASVIAKAADATVDASRAARNDIAANVGTVSDAEGAGEAVQRGADAMRKGSGLRGGRLYDKAETLAGGAKVQAPTAVAALDKHITDLSEMGNTNAPALKVLNGLKSDLVDAAGRPRQLSIQALRQLRTNTRDRIMQEGLRGSDLERRVGEILDGVGSDIAGGLTAAGKPDAAAAYKVADAFWKDRVDQIDNVLAPIIGKKGDKGATATFEAVERLAGPRGDPKRLARLMAAMPDDEANSVRATIISRLGQAVANKQNAEGDVFSPDTFLTNWNKLSNRSRAVLFDPKTRAALDDLAKVTGGTKAAQKYAGFSNTGAINAVNKTSTGLTVAAGALLTGHPLIAAAAASPAIGQYITAKMMTSPLMVRWLTRAPANTAAMRDHISKLAGIAARNPQMAGEIGSLEKALLSAVNDNIPATGRVAASPDKGPDREQ